MGNSATGGCCCCGCDVTPDAPKEIIPDPECGQVCEFTIKRAGWSGLSRDYQAYRGLDDPVEENRWLFLNKSGSTFGGDCKMAVENFIRNKPDNPKEGEILWEADFVDTPYFQQYLRVPDSAGYGVMMNEMFNNGFGGFMGRGHGWRDDDYYLSYGGGWDRDYVCTLYINWTCNTHAKLRTETRPKFGCDLVLGVYACGTAVARYFEVEEPIYETYEDSNGEQRQRIVGTRRRWEKHVREYVDSVQFSLVTAEAGPGWAKGQVIALPDGRPSAWEVPGNASDWTQNYDTPYFSVQQTGGWFSKDPKRIITKPGMDPALCLLVGHLGSTEFSAAGFKEALTPDFPYDPRGAVIMGMLNKRPPPPPVIVVQQPVIIVQAGMVAPQPQVMAQAMPQQPMAMAQPGMAMTQPMAQPGMAMTQPMAQPGMAMAQPMAQPGMAMAQPMAQPDMAMAQPAMAQAVPAQPAYDANYAASAVPQGAPVEPASVEVGMDDAHAQLAKLKKMMDAGLIDADDYEKKKDEILAKM